MARTKRKVNPLQSEISAPAISETVYRTAGYIRLSIKDGNRPGSETLDSQRRLVGAYIESAPSLALAGLYCDNGRTGTDFDRPEFDRLMEAVRRGEVNCIVVKDLSRFGRNYKETGNYLERVFPFLGVRFIAINDGFDSLTAARNEYGFIVPLKNLMNETYSRDISRKVSSALESKELSGEFIGVWAPYGYSKSPENRHKLTVNPDTAAVVQEIFSLRLDGLGYEKIARLLNEREVPSPSAYLFRVGLTKKERYRHTLWTAWNIKEISRNPVYLGHLVQGKRTQASYKQARVERYAPESEWRVVEDTHEALIDKVTFDAVRQIAEVRTEAYHAMLYTNGSIKTDNLFRSLVYCGHCGKALSRRQLRSGSGKFYYNFLCVTALNNPVVCSRKNLLERELLAVVTDSIRRFLTATTELEAHFRAVWEGRTAHERQALECQTTATKQELVRVQALYDGLYQNLVDGLITRREYLTMKERYQSLCEEKEILMTQFQQRQTELARFSPQNSMFSALREFQGAESLTTELIHALISRIEYGGGDDLRITLTYQDEFAALIQFVKEAGCA